MTVDSSIKEDIENRQKVFRNLVRTEGIEVAIRDGYDKNCKCLLPGGKTISGHAELLNYFKQDDGDCDYSFKFEDVNGNGEWAFIRGTYKAEKNGKDVDVGKFITIWRKTNGKFVIYNDMWNSSMTLY